VLHFFGSGTIQGLQLSYSCSYKCWSAHTNFVVLTSSTFHRNSGNCLQTSEACSLVGNSLKKGGCSFVKLMAFMMGSKGVTHVSHKASVGRNTRTADHQVKLIEYRSILTMPHYSCWMQDRKPRVALSKQGRQACKLLESKCVNTGRKDLTSKDQRIAHNLWLCNYGPVVHFIRPSTS